MNLKIHRLEYHNEDASEDAAIVGCDRQIIHIRVNIREDSDRQDAHRYQHPYFVREIRVF